MMKQFDSNAVERNFFKTGNPLKKLLKISLDMFDARQTGVLFGTNHTKIKFLPTGMWDRGIMGDFDGRGIRGLILKYFGARIIAARKLSPVFFFKKDRNGNLTDNDGIIAYVLRHCADYYKKGVSVIICPDSDQLIQQSCEKFIYMPFFGYDGNTFVRHENAIRVDAAIVRYFKSRNSIYIYLPDYGILVINTADTRLLEVNDGIFAKELELKKRLDSLIQMVEAASLAYLGQLTGKKGAQLLWRKEKHLREVSHELIKNEKRFRDLYENAPIAYISMDPSGTILRCNHKAQLLSGYESSQLIGQNALDLFIQRDQVKKEIFQAFKDCFAGKELKEFDIQIMLQNEELLWVSLSADAIKDKKDCIVELRMMIMDISLRKSLEKQLIQSRKMEAIGTLAGGIAHDFNNILSPISGYTEMLLMDMEKKDPRKENLDIIMDCVNHAKDLVAQILTFSIQKEHSLKAVDAGLAVNESITLVRSLLPATIKLHTDIDPSCKTILADPVQFHQVIMNLVANAYHSMNDGRQGDLDIILKNVNSKSVAALEEGVENYDYVCLSISDTGTGIKKDVLERIFDPYFSTRDEGEGSGIGLSVVHGIVEGHGGFIKVETSEGQGTRFDVYFPVCRTNAASEDSIPEKILIEKGTERILLVDDDKKVAVMETRMLEKLGYKVTCFTSSLNAIDVFKANPDLFDLILTDLTMPDVTGIQLADKVHDIRPCVPVVLCTGLGETIADGTLKQSSIKGFLKKPVAVRELSYTLRQALNLKPV